MLSHDDGYLTGPSRAAPERIALDYLRAHADVFGLDGDDLDGVRLTGSYLSRGRVHHLTFEQRAGSVPVLDGRLVANVAVDGRLLNLLGAPRPDVREPGAPALAAPAARKRAAAVTGGAADEPELVLLDGRLGWRALVETAAGEAREVIVDAEDGRTLQDRSLRHDAKARIFDTAPAGRSAARSAASSSARTSPSRRRPALRPLRLRVGRRGRRQPHRRRRGHPTQLRQRLRVHLHAVSNRCRRDLQRARLLLLESQRGVQLAHQPQRGRGQCLLAREPLPRSPGGAAIDFTPAKGAFEGADAVLVNVADGESLAAGLQDADHRNNATTRRCRPPRAPDVLLDTTHSLNFAEDAATIYHEYATAFRNGSCWALWRASRAIRWARRGATGTPWTTSRAAASPRHGGAG